MRNTLSKCSKVLNVCAIFHNYIINDDLDDDMDIMDIPLDKHCICVQPEDPYSMVYLPTVPDTMKIHGFSSLKLGYYKN